MEQNQQASPLAIVIAIIVLLVVLFAIYNLTLAKHSTPEPVPQGTTNGEGASPAPPGGQPAAENALPSGEPAQNTL